MPADPPNRTPPRIVTAKAAPMGGPPGAASGVYQLDLLAIADDGRRVECRFFMEAEAAAAIIEAAHPCAYFGGTFTAAGGST